MVKKRGGRCGKKLKILVMSERRQSGIREPRAWETVIRKFNVSKTGRWSWVITKSRIYLWVQTERVRGVEETGVERSTPGYWRVIHNDINGIHNNNKIWGR